MVITVRKTGQGKLDGSFAGAGMMNGETMCGVTVVEGFMVEVRLNVQVFGLKYGRARRRPKREGQKAIPADGAQAHHAFCRDTSAGSSRPVSSSSSSRSVSTRLASTRSKRAW